MCWFSLVELIGDDDSGVACPRPAFSATNWTNTFQPVLIKNSKSLKSTHRTKTIKLFLQSIIPPKCFVLFFTLTGMLKAAVNTTQFEFYLRVAGFFGCSGSERT